MSRHFVLTALLSLYIVAGCAPSSPLGQAGNPYPLPTPIAPDTLVHLKTGTVVSMPQMLADICDDRLVYVGETHDNPASHRLQQTILDALIQRYPNQLAVGMEMFHRGQQDTLDLWSAGALDEKTFIKQLHWFDNWGIDYAYYRDLLATMRDHHIPIIALNVPPEQKMAVMHGEAATLEVEDPYYQATLMAYFSGHQHGNADAETFVRIQNLWDNTMAQSVVDYLNQPEQGQHHLLILAGGNHVRYGFGIPRRVYQQLPLSYSLVGNHEVEVDESKRDRFMDVTLPELPLLPYDYLLYNRYEAGPQHQQIGILLEQSGSNVVIQRVISDSLAQQAGLLAEDVIISVNEARVEEPFDVIYPIRQAQPGDTLQLTIDRNGTALTLPVTF